MVVPFFCKWYFIEIYHKNQDIQSSIKSYHIIYFS